MIFSFYSTCCITIRRLLTSFFIVISLICLHRIIWMLLTTFFILMFFSCLWLSKWSFEAWFLVCFNICHLSVPDLTTISFRLYQLVNAVYYIHFFFCPRFVPRLVQITSVGECYWLHSLPFCPRFVTPLIQNISARKWYCLHSSPGRRMFINQFVTWLTHVHAFWLCRMSTTTYYFTRLTSRLSLFAYSLAIDVVITRLNSGFIWMYFDVHFAGWTYCYTI